jgi:hypothetical protein
MPKLLNISNPPHPRIIYWTLVVVICGVLLIAGLTLNSSASGWISEAAQAEFASSMPAGPAAAQVAQPGRSILIVRAE